MHHFKKAHSISHRSSIPFFRQLSHEEIIGRNSFMPLSKV